MWRKDSIWGAIGVMIAVVARQRNRDGGATDPQRRRKMGCNRRHFVGGPFPLRRGYVGRSSRAERGSSWMTSTTVPRGLREATVGEFGVAIERPPEQLPGLRGGIRVRASRDCSPVSFFDEMRSSNGGPPTEPWRTGNGPPTEGQRMHPFYAVAGGLVVAYHI